MSAVETFRNVRTGLVWDVNPGSPEHTRMAASADFVRVEREQPKRRSSRKTERPDDVSGE